MGRPAAYDDFVLRIGGRSGRSFEVTAEAHGRQGSGGFEPPLSPRHLHELFARLEGRNLSPATEAGAPELSFAEAGTRLFDALLSGEILRLYEQSVLEARWRRRGLRLVIKLDPRSPDRAALLTLPWELIHRAEEQRFLALSRQRPVARFAELPDAPTGTVARGRLRVLLASASPADLPRLEVEREVDLVRAALHGRWFGVLDHLPMATLQGLRERLLDRPYHIIHFIGHGGYDPDRAEGFLIFGGFDGTGEKVTGGELAANVRDFESVGLVVLNACETARAVAEPGLNPFTGVAQALILAGVPRVLAMQAPVSDRAAVAFSRSFYRQLAAGDPVDAAVVEGRLAIVGATRPPGSWRADRSAIAGAPGGARPEWAVPTLILRADGSLRSPPGRRWWKMVGALLLAVAAVGPSLLREDEVRVHVGDLRVVGEGSAEERRAAAGVREALIQKFSSIDTRHRIVVTCIRCPKLEQAARERLGVDYTIAGEIRLGEPTVAVASLYGRSGRLTARVLVRDEPGAGLDLSHLEQELATAILDRLGVRLPLPALAALAATATPDSAALEHNNEGVARLDRGDLEGASNAFEAALAADPAFVAALVNLAHLEARQGRDGRALELYRRAVERLPGYAVLHFDLGHFLLHGMKGDRSASAAAALPSLARAVELDPGYGEAYNELGAAWLATGRPAEARKALEVAVDLLPDRPEPRRNLARVDLAEGRGTAAVRRLEEALARTAAGELWSRVETLSWLTRAHLGTGDRTSVCRTAAEVRRLDTAGLSDGARAAERAAHEADCGSVEWN